MVVVVLVGGALVVLGVLVLVVLVAPGVLGMLVNESGSVVVVLACAGVVVAAVPLALAANKP